MGGLGLALALECHEQFSLMENERSEMPHPTAVSLNVFFLKRFECDLLHLQFVGRLKQVLQGFEHLLGNRVYR